MIRTFKKRSNPFAPNLKMAHSLWGALSLSARQQLIDLTEKYRLSVTAGDIRLLDGRWYITHSGLLAISVRRRCAGIRTAVERNLSDPASGRWIFRATVYKSPRSRAFVGFGDASPSNVSPLVRGAEMRVAETRAVNRALRKAYGIGLCSVEELGWSPREPEPAVVKRQEPTSSSNNGHSNGQPRLRDRLCMLVRKYQLDPTLVKLFAADYCGTANLKDAGRDLVEAFIDDLAERATKDRAGLICHLNSYAQPREVNS